jgi:hypothetical protein
VTISLPNLSWTNFLDNFDQLQFALGSGLYFCSAWHDLAIPGHPSVLSMLVNLNMFKLDVTPVAGACQGQSEHVQIRAWLAGLECVSPGLVKEK